MPYINSLNRHVADITKLPVSEVVKGGYSAASLIVQTPHKGEVVIEIKERHHPFIGGNTETEKTTKELWRELIKLEEDAKEYLLEKWLKESKTS